MAEAKIVYRLNRKNGVTYIYLDEPDWDKEKKVSWTTVNIVDSKKEDINDFHS